MSDIYRDEGQGVVFVRSEGVSSGESSQSPFGQPDDQRGTATGSGFVVDRQGYVVTNAHVVEGASKVSVSFDEKTSSFVDAEVKGTDVSSDLAVLKIDPDDVKDMKVLPLGDSSDAKVGAPTIAIGNPFGFTRTVTTGIVSAVQRTIEAPNNFSIADVIQTDAAINPGNSGGPLLDAQGRVIGINAQIATGGQSSGGSIGIGFAIPVNTLKKLLPELKSDKSIKRGFLGVTTASVNNEVADDLNLATKSGAIIQDVTEGGPADKAGLRAGGTATADGLAAGGDVIVSVDGKPVKSSDELVAIIAGKKPGEEVEIEYLRGRSDDRKTAKVTLGNRPAKVAEPERPAAALMRCQESGIHARFLNGGSAILGREWAREVKDLWDHRSRRRAPGRRAGRLGAGAELLAPERAPLPAGRGRGDRGQLQAQRRAGGRVRERHARRGGSAQPTATS